MTPEFSRPERIDTIGEGGRTVAIEADAEERRRLAGRFGLIAVERLTAAFTLHRDGDAIVADGRVQAAVTQACAATGEPLPARVDEPVALRFVAEAAAGGDVELAAAALDTLPIDGGAIDLGEAAAETMALTLDPFARGPDADAALRAAGVVGEGQAGPLGGLAALRDKLARG